MFKLPLREIKKRFTISELYMLSWRSAEQSAQLKKKFKDVEYDNENQSEGGSPSRPSGVKKRKSGNIPPGLPDHFFNAEGEVDLRQVTGDEAWRFFAAQGIKLPIIPRSDGK